MYAHTHAANTLTIVIATRVDLSAWPQYNSVLSILQYWKSNKWQPCPLTQLPLPTMQIAVKKGVEPPRFQVIDTLELDRSASCAALITVSSNVHHVVKLYLVSFSQVAVSKGCSTTDALNGFRQESGHLA